MTLNELYQFADQNGIDVYTRKLSGIKGLAVKSLCYHIALNKDLIDGEKEERIILAHEVAHCITDQFYYQQDINNPLYRQNIRKAERIATDYACTYLVSVEELKIVSQQYANDYEIAEALDIDMNLLHKIVDYYKRKNLLE